MAVTNVSIANQALTILGVAKKLSDLADPNSSNARTLNGVFDSVRRTLLRQYQYHFSKVRVSLPALSTTTVWGNLQRYQLPSDCLFLLRPKDKRVDWVIEGRTIVTGDGAPLNVMYIADITDPAQFDPCFIDVFAAKLAVVTCQEITESAGKQQIADARLKEAYAEARQQNSYESDGDTSLADDYFLAMGCVPSAGVPRPFFHG